MEDLLPYAACSLVDTADAGQVLKSVFQTWEVYLARLGFDSYAVKFALNVVVALDTAAYQV